MSEKSQTRGVKAPHNSEFIPVESFEVGKVRAAFTQLCSAVCPATTDVEQKLLTRIEESGWLQLVQELLYHTALVVDLINEDGSSVVLCLEEGWDVTCQLSALVQLCLDPHYRLELLPASLAVLSYCLDSFECEFPKSKHLPDLFCESQFKLILAAGKSTDSAH